VKISREIKIGTLTIVSLILLIWGLNYLKGVDVLKKQRVFYAVYDRVDGLVKANPVSINGLQVGQVNNLYFSKDGSTKIIAEILITTDINIPDNSIAQIFSSDLMGSKAVNLMFGNSVRYIQPGDTLATEVEGSLKDEVNKQVLPLKRKAENLLSSLDTMVTIIQDIFNKKTKENLNASFTNIRSAISHLENTTVNIDTLISTQKSYI